MEDIFRLKPIINKKNGQMNFSLSKKDMPELLKKFMKSNPKKSKLPFFKMKFEGVEF